MTSKWLEWNYNNSNKKLRTSKLDTFNVNFNSSPLLTTNISDAIAITCKKVQEEANHKKIKLFLSGGYDSQFIALMFLKHNITFSPIIMKYNITTGLLNHDDFVNALEFCKKFTLQPEIISIDIIDFYLSKKYLIYAPSSQCNCAPIYCFFDAISQIKDDFFLMGQGDIDYFDNSYIFREQLFCIQKFANANNILGNSRFYEMTFDIFYWFDRLYNVAKSTDQVYEIKENFMNMHGLANRKKLTGFSGIVHAFDKSVFDNLQYDLIDKFPTLDDNKKIWHTTGIGGNYALVPKILHKNDSF